jgi:YggT family protein
MEYFVRAVIVVCYVLIIAIVIRSLLSWFPIDRNNVLAHVLESVTDPILAPLRRIIPRLDMIDFAPMVAIILLYVITWALRPYAG